MSDTRPYSIDIEGIRRAFPHGTEPPALLIDFAKWLEGRPWGSAGCFEIVGQFSEEAPIFDGSPLRESFALFGWLPEGSAFGAWLGAGHDIASAPIVLLGSEGQYEILATSLEGLLAKIALRRFEEDGEWTDFTPDEDGEDTTDGLADWLRRRLDVKELEKLIENPSGLPDFAQWMQKRRSDREDFWTAHPTVARLSSHLTAHRPKGTNPWDSRVFEVAIVGAQFQARVLRGGRQPVEEAADIEPVLRELREEMCRDRPDLGLWYSMWFTLYADGRIFPNFDYQNRPTIGEQPADLAEAKADLLRAPRPERWVPRWLANS